MNDIDATSDDRARFDFWFSAIYLAIWLSLCAAFFFYWSSLNNVARIILGFAMSALAPSLRDVYRAALTKFGKKGQQS